jgi:hypothetical protein
MQFRASAKTFGFVAIASLLSCGRPATFPRGGPVRATGVCEATVDRAPPPTTTIRRVRTPWLGQAGSATNADGYGHGLGDASGNVVLRFEAGRLTSLAVEEPTSETFDPHAPRQVSSPPRWRGEGARDEVFVEGRPYDVRVVVVSPPGAGGNEHVRVTFEGERVLVVWRGRAAVAQCAWETREAALGRAFR